MVPETGELYDLPLIPSFNHCFIRSFSARFEVLTAVTMKNVFRDMTPFILVDQFPHFREIGCFHLQGRKEIK
jgi:hypothetical protein